MPFTISSKKIQFCQAWPTISPMDWKFYGNLQNKRTKIKIISRAKCKITLLHLWLSTDSKHICQQMV